MGGGVFSPSLYVAVILGKPKRTMTGQCFINNTDIWISYKACLSDNSYENLLLPASPKPLTENKTPLNDGKNVIMPATRKVDEREVMITFDISGTTRADYLTNFNGFVSKLSGAVSLKVPDLKTVYNLTVVKYESLSTGPGVKSSKLIVRFNEPNPANRTAL